MWISVWVGCSSVCCGSECCSTIRITSASGAVIPCVEISVMTPWYLYWLLRQFGHIGRKGMLKMKTKFTPRNMKKHWSLYSKITMKMKSEISSVYIYTKITISKNIHLLFLTPFFSNIYINYFYNSHFLSSDIYIFTCTVLLLSCAAESGWNLEWHYPAPRVNSKGTIYFQKQHTGYGHEI